MCTTMLLHGLNYQSAQTVWNSEENLTMYSLQDLQDLLDHQLYIIITIIINIIRTLEIFCSSILLYAD